MNRVNGNDLRSDGLSFFEVLLQVYLNNFDDAFFGWIRSFHEGCPCLHPSPHLQQQNRFEYGFKVVIYYVQFSLFSHPGGPLVLMLFAKLQQQVKVFQLFLHPFQLSLARIPLLASTFYKEHHFAASCLIMLSVNSSG